MPNSKDPERYDPAFAAVLTHMEEGAPTITISFPSMTKANSFKMRLYSYAEAWKAESLRLAKADPIASQIAMGKAKTLARYRLRNIGLQVVCDNRDNPDFEMPTITTRGTPIPRLSPAEASKLVAALPTPGITPPTTPKEQMSQANQSFLDLLDNVDKPGFHPTVAMPVEASAEDLNGPTSEGEIGPN